MDKKHLNVVAAVIRDGSKILATQRGYGNYKGSWEFPGGKMEQGETCEQALVREIQEELDVLVSVHELIETVEYEYPEFYLTMHCFWCSIKEGKIILKEHDDAKWLTKDELDSVAWLAADLGVVEKIKQALSEE